jgi:hypothetical protein
MAKRAVCVGINDYPGTDMDLAGCVNDSHDWRAVLEARGYTVEQRLNAEATRDGVIDALTRLFGGAAAGDTLVFTFSGHGSWLPDADSDEPDGRDEMMCTYDVMQDHYLLDDDLYALFSTKPDGARLYVIADCCHSGSVTRYAEAPKKPDQVVTKARFLPPYVFARGDVNIEHAIDQAACTPATKKLDYPALLFAGCDDSEFSYDTAFGGRPNGAFTRTAIDALQDASIKTPRALYDAIRRRLPSPVLPQTPQLFGSDAEMAGALF